MTAGETSMHVEEREAGLRRESGQGLGRPGQALGAVSLHSWSLPGLRIMRRAVVTQHADYTML